MPIILNGTTGITTPGITNTGTFTFQGAVELPAGTVSAPSLTTTGDTNTGIYFPAADMIAFSQGGTESVRINASGNVGIGTTTPTSFSNSKYLTINGTNTAGIVFRNSGSDVMWLYATSSGFYIEDQQTQPIIFSINTYEKMRIAASGNVGIGTSSPSSKLNVLGSTDCAFFSAGSASYFALGLSTANGNRMYLTTVGASDESLKFVNASGSELMRLTSGGNLGIGTSSPQSTYKLTISGTDSVFPAVYLDNTTNSKAYSMRVTGTSWIIRDNTAGTDRLTLDTSGNLGIGTSSPGYKLSVSGVATTYAASGSLALYDTVSGVADSRNWLIGNVAAGNYGELNFAVSSAAGGAPTNSKMTLDRSGNLGLGVTPSAWSSYYRPLQAGTNGAFAGGNDDSVFTSNAYYDGNWKYITSSVAATRLRQTGGTFTFSTAPSGTAGNTISFTQAMTLDASARLMMDRVADSAFTARLTGNQDFFGIWVSNGVASGGSGTSKGRIGLYYDNNLGNENGAIEFTRGGSATDGSILFRTNGSERARITSGGDLLVGTTTTSGKVSVFNSSSDASQSCIQVQNNKNFAGIQGINITSGNIFNDTGHEFLSCNDLAGGGATRMTVRSNGGIANYQANDVNLSDQRVKKDVKPLGSMWDKFKAIEIVTFKYNDQTHDDDNIGVIAQQVESVAPEFIDIDGFGETPEDGVPLKTVYTTDMYHAAIKALQEAMSRIEKLEAEVSALKGVQ